MSDAVFPSLPGLKPERPRTPGFATKIQRSVSGSEARAALQAYPLRKFSLAFEVLRHGTENDLRILEGFFLARPIPSNNDGVRRFWLHPSKSRHKP